MISGAFKMTYSLSTPRRVLIVFLLPIALLATTCFSFTSNNQYNAALLTKLQSVPGSTEATGVASSSSPDTDDSMQEFSKPEHSCQFCHEGFASRNALFRHFKSSRDCAAKANMLDEELKTIALALQFSYFSQDLTSCEASKAGKQLQEALIPAVQRFLENDSNPQQAPSDVSKKVALLGSSQGSLARLRHIALDQEVGCAAAGDTLVVRIEGPYLEFDDNQSQRRFLDHIVKCTNKILSEQDEIIAVQVEACKFLAPTDGKLIHGEQSCTQRVYHYLLPIKWLPDGDLLKKWWVDSGVAEVDGHKNKSMVRPPSESLKRMKRYLRLAEAERLDRNLEEENIRWASGRFGALGEKRRVAWHNFADPKLQGSASPNTKPVWRVLDRARFQLLFSRDTKLNEKEVVAVLEFRGDDFLPQQIRRLVGTTLGMTRGWLPPNTLDVATRADSFVETALAPPGRIYLVENRFHWNEMRTGGKSIFESDVDGVAVGRVTDKQGEATVNIQTKMLDALDDDRIRAEESQWLVDLEVSVCPRIRQNLEEWQNPVQHLKDSNLPSLEGLMPMPSAYERALSILRGIIAEDRWPETSVARSTVIGNVGRCDEDIVRKRGSFTVVNPKFRDGLYKNGVGNDFLPLGNLLFPELVEAVFSLEEYLSSAEKIPSGKRPASSHCAVNCNAQFTPHVDSGRGAGQSLSMIVGLGDYLGGELGVEGVGHDIRYKPLEFDGWRLRHWTKPFHGERFSLVWFTPELKGDEKDARTHIEEDRL